MLRYYGTRKPRVMIDPWQPPVRGVPISEETMRPYLGKFLAVSKNIGRARTSAIWRLWNPERGTTLTGTASIRWLESWCTWPHHSGSFKLFPRLIPARYHNCVSRGNSWILANISSHMLKYKTQDNTMIGELRGHVREFGNSRQRKGRRSERAGRRRARPGPQGSRKSGPRRCAPVEEKFSGNTGQL